MARLGGLEALWLLPTLPCSLLEVALRFAVAGSPSRRPDLDHDPDDRADRADGCERQADDLHESPSSTPSM